ncbi:hypothetical protein I7860_10485 [Pseudomonas tolaasii]|uniref:hypothetical protein n=1 Tax=Pseudomonas TaxID=286 RepID=UPI000F55C93A|nr:MULTISPECIES: hypothetical protein [Pseudomonas]MBW1247101.1 hypothetical protein [Pseudomonas tolaasii]
MGFYQQVAHTSLGKKKDIQNSKNTSFLLSVYEKIWRLPNQMDWTQMIFFNRKLLATAVLIGSVTLLAGCQEKIEAPSVSVLKASIQKISKELDPVEQVKFQEAFESGMNYVYAKNHGGRTPDQNIGNIFGQVMRGMQGQAVDTSAEDATERDLLELFDGKTASKVISQKEDWDEELVKLKAQWQKAQNELAEQRQKQIVENARIQKLEYARQQKVQLTQNITQLEQNIPKLEAQISEYEIKKKPFTDAVADYPKVQIKNVAIKIDGPRKRFVEFDVVNGSQVQFNEIVFNVKLAADSGVITNPTSRLSIDGAGVVPGSSYHVSYNVSASSAYRYEPSDLQVDVTLIKATDLSTKVGVAENLDDAGWKSWFENSLVGYKNQLEQTKKRIEDYQKQLAAMDQSDTSA